MDDSYQLPKVEEIRRIIDNMPIKTESNLRYRTAFRYLYLIAGRVSEITKQYGPSGNDARLVDIGGVKAVLFLVRTAQREGRLRPVAIPIDPYYEPWTESIYEWFKAHGDKNPFGDMHVRSFQRMARMVFDGLKWPVEKYFKMEYKEVEPSKIKYERTVDGVKEYLVEYEDLERRWVKDPRIAATTVEMGGYWRDFSIQSLRHLRIFELRAYYNFIKDQIETYTGLTGMSREDLTSRMLNRYQLIGSRNGDLQLAHQKQIAGTYFRNLLKSRIYELLQES